MGSLECDPEAFALAIVQQYLHEHGHGHALAALEREAGLRYVESKLPRAAQLLHLVWSHCEATLAAQLSATTLAPAAAAEAAAVEELRRRTCAEAAALRNVEPLAAGLSSNPTALCVGGSGCLYVCTGAGELLCVRSEGAAEPIAWRTSVAPCALLSVDSTADAQQRAKAQQKLGLDASAGDPTEPSTCTDLLLASAMDGHVHAISAKGAVLCSVKVAGRLVPKVAWCPAPQEQEHAETARGASSHAGGDATTRDTRAAGGAAADGAACGRLALAATGAAEVVALRWRCGACARCGGAEAALHVVQRVAFAANVADVAFAHLAVVTSANDASGAGLHAIVAVRDAHELRAIPLHVDGGDTPLQTQAERRWNMNTHGDAHVSFHATQLRPSPDGRHLLVSTSAARLLVLPLATAAAAPPRPVASLHGLRTDTFHLPCTAWHPAGAHVLAADCTGAIQVFHVGTGRIEATLAGHSASVRGMRFLSSNAVATCSFDKSIRVWRS